MSASIGTFQRRHHFHEDTMHLQALIGGEDGSSIQFTIGGKYACLSEGQLKTLMVLIAERLSGQISATGHDYDYFITRSGTIMDESGEHPRGGEYEVTNG